jgi:hypothetical protein
MGLVRRPEHALRIVECGGASVCIALLSHPSYHVSRAALQLLDEMLTRYRDIILPALVQRVEKTHYISGCWLGIKFGDGYGLGWPSLMLLIDSCERFLRLGIGLHSSRSSSTTSPSTTTQTESKSDDTSFDYDPPRDQRSDIAYRILLNMCHHPSALHLIKNKADWKINRLSDIIEAYDDGGGRPTHEVGGWKGAWTPGTSGSGELVDHIASTFQVKQCTSLKRCNLKSCGLVERVAGSFQACRRCLSVAYCCTEHQRVAWQAWHSKECRIAKKHYNMGHYPIDRPSSNSSSLSSSSTNTTTSVTPSSSMSTANGGSRSPSSLGPLARARARQQQLAASSRQARSGNGNDRTPITSTSTSSPSNSALEPTMMHAPSLLVTSPPNRPSSSSPSSSSPSRAARVMAKVSILSPSTARASMHMANGSPVTPTRIGVLFKPRSQLR